jgi:hypothetical protein
MEIAPPPSAEKKRSRSLPLGVEKKALENSKKAAKANNVANGKKDMAAFDTFDATIDELAASAAASSSMPPTPPSGNCLSKYTPRLLGMPIVLPTKLPACPAFPWYGSGSSWDGSGSCST